MNEIGADYPGHDLSDVFDLQPIAGVGPVGLVKSSGVWLSDDYAQAGSHSLCVGPGGFKEMFYAALAEETTINAYVYPLAGSKPIFYVVDLGNCVKASATPAGVGAWEALQLVFVAEKKIYKIVIANPIPIIGTGLGDGEKGWCYFDSIK